MYFLKYMKKFYVSSLFWIVCTLSVYLVVVMMMLEIDDDDAT